MNTKITQQLVCVLLVIWPSLYVHVVTDTTPFNECSYYIKLHECRKINFSGGGGGGAKDENLNMLHKQPPWGIWGHALRSLLVQSKY